MQKMLCNNKGREKARLIENAVFNLPEPKFLTWMHKHFLVCVYVFTVRSEIAFFNC